MELWIVVAAHNEAEVIAETLAGLQAVTCRTVVVDDGSTDLTAAIARASGARVLRHIVNLGQGAALQTGIEYALSQGAMHICTFDADGQHSALAIPLLLDALVRERCDVALASRFLERTEMPTMRRALLLAARAFTRFQTKLELTDVHNGLRIFTREAAQKLRIRQSRMAHASEILSLMARHRLTYVEVPVATAYTPYSLSKGQTTMSSIRILFDLFYASWSR